MRIYEITNPQEQLALLRTIFDNSWTEIAQQARYSQSKKVPRNPKPKTHKPPIKRAVQAKSMQPTKPKTITPAVKPVSTKQPPIKTINQRSINKPISAPMPASLKPLPTSILSPVDGPEAQREVEWSKQIKPL